MTVSPDETRYDVVAVGCGPFNLGLAALADGVEDLSVAVFDREPELRWHPGLMFEDAMLQVSFLADLVTLIDPTHRLSFLAYLVDQDRMFPFYVREQFHPTRPEYEDYLRWAASSLPSVRFGHDVTSVAWDAAAERFRLEVTGPDGEELHVSARDVVLGLGTAPHLPEALAALPEDRVLHSSQYLHRRDDVAAARRVTVVGSGQSGAEATLDLLRRGRDTGAGVAWLTRSSGFAPLDYSKFLLEMTTPEYVDHFHTLPESKRDQLVADQWRHYKGVSEETIDLLHDELYRRSLVRDLAPAELRQGVAVESAEQADGGGVVLHCREADTGETLRHRTDLVVAATGYRERTPDLLAPLADAVHRDGRGRYVVRRDHSVELDAAITGRVFVANADTHTHGVAAPDLGLGAHRNAMIINAVTGRKVYRLPERTGFISFGPAEA